MIVEVQKWGNSLAIRVPAAIAREIGIRTRTKVSVTAANGTLVAAPVDWEAIFDGPGPADRWVGVLHQGTTAETRAQRRVRRTLEKHA